MRRIIVFAVIALVLLESAALAWTSGESVTVMAYMCGSDLETKGGSASRDIVEMVNAERNDRVKVVIETGGAKEWHIEGLEGGKNQRLLIEGEGLSILETSAARDMTDPQTLESFITYCAENYPADRYILVMWDHGGGSVYGFGSDENFPGGSMAIDEIRQALSDAGVHFDIIGFDACLMATVENAVSVAPYADYLVASEEIEPGSGWEQTSWLSALANEPDITSLALGKTIVDGYIASVSDGKTEGTLSVTDLSAVRERISDVMGEFANEAAGMIISNEFQKLSRARQGAKAFGYKEHELVDMADFISRSGVASADEFIEAVDSLVAYRADTGNMRCVCGLSMYFPYYDMGSVNKMAAIYENIGFNGKYIDLARSFASVRENGQAMISSDQSPLSTSGGGTVDVSAVQESSGSSWLNALFDCVDYVSSHYLPEDSLELSEKDGGYVLSLSDEEWDLIVNTQLNVFMDDGEGYIDLGLDDAVDYDYDGDLIADFDYQWVALNGQTVAFYSGDYAENDGKFRYTGYVPVLLNGQDAEIVLAWDSQHDSGYVAGVRQVFSHQAALTRGLQKLEQGDVISPLCDYYNYDGSFYDEYILGDDIIVDGDIEVSYEDIGDANAQISFLLTDIYGNTYWTESVSYE